MIILVIRKCLITPWHCLSRFSEYGWFPTYWWRSSLRNTSVLDLNVWTFIELKNGLAFLDSTDIRQLKVKRENSLLCLPAIWRNPLPSRPKKKKPSFLTIFLVLLICFLIIWMQELWSYKWSYKFLPWLTYIYNGTVKKNGNFQIDIISWQIC